MLRLDTIPVMNQSDRSTETPRSLSSDEDYNDVIIFKRKNLRKIAPNVYEIIGKNKVLKVSKHECFNMACIDHSISDEDEEDIDEDDFDHSDKC